MRFLSVSYQIPDPEGAAAGRLLHATVEGLLEAGHDVEAVTWRPEPPDGPLPDWCSWVPFPTRSALRTRVAAVLRPRSESSALDLAPGPGTVAVAEDYLSFPAIAHHPTSALVVHNLNRLDSASVARRRPSDLQDARGETRALRRAPLVLASSARVAGSAPVRSRVVPVGHHVPASAVDPVEEPVAANLADWRWPPNRWALDHLLRAWPTVRAEVPGARLLLAGRGLESVGAIPGVEVLGPVARSVDVLARAGVLAFPCPPTTGPKIKVLEALLHGVPVVTTLAGAEGLAVEAGTDVVVTDLAGFARALAATLSDPAARWSMGRRGRAATVAGHSPVVAAAARVDACRSLLSDRPPV